MLEWMIELDSVTPVEPFLPCFLLIVNRYFASNRIFNEQLRNIMLGSIIILTGINNLRKSFKLIKRVLSLELPLRSSQKKIAAALVSISVSSIAKVDFERLICNSSMYAVWNRWLCNRLCSRNLLI